MTVQTTAHVNFRGQAREALTCYRSVFGGEIALATYADIHAVEEPAQADQIAFGRVTAPNGFDLMAYDGPLYGMLTDRFGVTGIIGVSS